MKIFLHSPPSEIPRLLLREWGAVAFLVVAMAGAVFVSQFKRVGAADQLERENVRRSQAQISVFLKGAVKHPGVYTCDPGTTLGELLKEAKLTKNAERKQLVLKKILLSSQEIEIPEKGSVS